MSITEYGKSNTEIIDYKESKIGLLYFFENYVITEFKEGVHINYENFDESAKNINDFFGKKSFGVIANRTNSYSLDLNDAKKWNTIFPTLKAYAVVSDRLFSQGVFDLENQFFEYNRQIFKTLDEAIEWVKETLENN